ncbi:MAG: hypothetical protein JNK06_03830 [Candidatus Accumulibacter phosphatis]|nr:hypothetical protein [Candidatus Accumulibacter phosphatis]
MVMENEPFPILPPTFSGNSRSVDVGNVFDWLRQGWATFIVNPGTWIAMMVITIVIFIGLAIVPLIGQLAAHLLTPVLAAGMLVACRKVASEETLEIADLFAGFQRNTGPLMMLGVLYMIGMLLVSLLVLALAGGGLAGGLMMGSPVGASIAVGGFLVGAMLWLALSVPIAMAIWFAPALVLFNNMPPVDALKASFNACLRNIVAFLVFGLIVMVLSFFAALPIGLGFLVLGPVLAGAIYASYRDIFAAA